jgi:hypothetical protein
MRAVLVAGAVVLACSTSVAAPLETAATTQKQAQRRWPLGFVASTGATCVNVAQGSTCMASIRAGFEFGVGELHVGTVILPGTSASAVGGAESLISNYSGGDANTGTRPGFQVGIELGTPYFTVTDQRRRVRLMIAGRAGLDVDGLFVPPDGSFTWLIVTNTYGPKLALTIGKHVSLYFHPSVGWSRIEGLKADIAYTFTLDNRFGVQLLY